MQIVCHKKVASSTFFYDVDELSKVEEGGRGGLFHPDDIAVLIFDR